MLQEGLLALKETWPESKWSSLYLGEARVLLVIAGPFAQSLKPIKDVTYPFK